MAIFIKFLLDKIDLLLMLLISELTHLSVVFGPRASVPPPPFKTCKMYQWDGGYCIMAITKEYSFYEAYDLT